ncbi:MAG: hypothetical protein P4L68_03640 [Methylovirgula sp.]|nr:hypothetical protein [Methylovirgula sp.]
MSPTDTTTGFAAAARHSPARAQQPLPAWLLIAIASGFSAVLSAASISSVWQKNTFFDSDDAMQLVEVRGLLNGQNWFDLTAARLDPPQGVFMHWSRLIDAPLALLIWLFELFMPAPDAERLTRILFPLILLTLLYVGVAQLARRLMGEQGVLPALLLALLSCSVFGQFQPGHITHSASQVVLLVFMLGSFVAGLASSHVRGAALAGVLAAISLAISLENLPFIATLAASAVLLWVVRGEDLRGPLLAFGLGLGLTLPVVFFATIGPARWSDNACDAFSRAYLIPGLAGASVLALLGFSAPRLQSWPSRLVAALLAGCAVLAAAALTRPACFLDPYAGIDPLLREIWLKHVEEAQPLAGFAASRPTVALVLAMPVVLGLVATFAAIWREQGLTRLRWIVVAAMTGTGFLLVFWQIRLIAFACPLALLGSTWAIVRFKDYLKTRWQEAASLAFLLVVPFSSLGWALAVPGTSGGALDTRKGCLSTSAFAPLAQLPPGLIAGPIDAGSHILALTPHSVLAAPYHRDNHGNRIVLDALLATPDRAHDVLKNARVTYVVNCDGLGEFAVLAANAPKSFAARIVTGIPPAWLMPLPQKGPYQVFVMKP